LVATFLDFLFLHLLASQYQSHEKKTRISGSQQMFRSTFPMALSTLNHGRTHSLILKCRFTGHPNCRYCCNFSLFLLFPL
jgi:hypothetical protein